MGGLDFRAVIVKDRPVGGGMPAAGELAEYYTTLLEHFGPCNWWPGESPFEVALGGVLTQNTSWRNVEKALEKLKGVCRLTPRAVWDLPPGDLQEAIRPAGFYSVKARRLRNLLAWFAHKSGQDDPPDDPQLDFLRDEDGDSLREGLLSVPGIGRESADSILLYALGLPYFVVDAYTFRMLHRHGFVGEDAGYDEMQDLFYAVLPDDHKLYNEYHALIVRLGQNYCGKQKPLCKACPLGAFMEYWP